MQECFKLIRCKDCAKYYQYHDPYSETRWCSQWCQRTDPNGYCHKAVPRTYRADWVQDDPDYTTTDGEPHE